MDLIVAVDSCWGIAKNGIIPWCIKEDQTFFQDITKVGKKNVLIMGKNTWKTLPPNFRGLKDRINVVVSSTMTTEELVIDNETKCEAYLCKTFDESLELCKGLDKGRIFICGGIGIYTEALNKINFDNIYLTKIDHDYGCNSIFPHELLVNDNCYFNEEFIVKDHNSGVNVNVTFMKFGNGGKIINKEECAYLDLLKYIIKNGEYDEGRNGFTWSVFGKHLEFDVGVGFPLLTTKKVFFKGIFEELIFFLRGDTNAKHLDEKGVKIWNPNTTREFLDANGKNDYKEFDMGPMYGFQLLHFNATYEGMDKDYEGKGINQIDYCLDLIKNNPKSRRIIMTTYNPLQAKEGVLFPCHGIAIIWYVENKNKLCCMMVQRSADTFCGVPFNIASYALMMHMFCEIINNDDDYKGPLLMPGRLVMSLSDCHVYGVHHEQTVRQLLRQPYKFPQLRFKRKINNLNDFTFDDVELVNYESHPAIPVKMVA